MKKAKFGNKEMKDIEKNHFGKLPTKLLIEEILPIMAIDLFKKERLLKRVVIWNWILIALLVLDLIAFWLPKLIK